MKESGRAPAGDKGAAIAPLFVFLLSAREKPCVIDTGQFETEVSKVPPSWTISLSDHPKPANEYHLKTGQRE